MKLQFGASSAVFACQAGWRVRFPSPIPIPWKRAFGERISTRSLRVGEKWLADRSPATSRVCKSFDKGLYYVRLLPFSSRDSCPPLQRAFFCLRSKAPWGLALPGRLHAQAHCARCRQEGFSQCGSKAGAASPGRQIGLDSPAGSRKQREDAGLIRRPPTQDSLQRARGALVSIRRVRGPVPILQAVMHRLAADQHHRRGFLLRAG